MMLSAMLYIWFAFLSTLPARGATQFVLTDQRPKQNFYPRSPRGERPAEIGEAAATLDFYPRSPRGERLRRSCSTR